MRDGHVLRNRILETRRVLDEAYEALGRPSPDLEQCFCAVVFSAHDLLGLPEVSESSLRGWLGITVDIPPTIASPWFTLGTQEHQDLHRTLALACHCLERREEMDDGGRAGVAAALLATLRLLERLLPQDARNLLQPLRYELDCLTSLDSGTIHWIHEPKSAVSGVEPQLPAALPHRVDDPHSWFTPGAGPYGALRDNLEQAHRRFLEGGELRDGGRSGVIAALAVVIDLFERVLPPADTNLLAPLAHELQALTALQHGRRRFPIHLPSDHPVERGPKTGDRREFQTLCVALAEALYWNNNRNGGRRAADAEATRIARNAANRVGVTMGEDSIARWRSERPRGRVDWNRAKEVARRRCIIHAINCGSAKALVRELSRSLELVNFSHRVTRLGATREEDLDRQRRRNRDYQRRSRRKRRAAHD